VIPNFSLAGSVLSRKHDLEKFVHERLDWSLVDQSPDQSKTEWLCVVVARYNINPLSPTWATFLVELCNPITLQAIELKSCSNPLQIQQVF